MVGKYDESVSDSRAKNRKSTFSCMLRNATCMLVATLSPLGTESRASVCEWHIFTGKQVKEHDAAFQELQDIIENSFGKTRLIFQYETKQYLERICCAERAANHAYPQAV